MRIPLDSFPWERYAPRLRDYIMKPQCMGLFTNERAEAQDLRLAYGEEGSLEEGNIAALFFLVDPSDGSVVDAKFQVFGQSALLGACEALCRLSIGKNYDQVRRFTADFVEHELGAKPGENAFPIETAAHLNLALGALEQAMESCMDIPLPETYVTPMAREVEVLEGGYPGFAEMSLKKKLALIEEVIAQEIRPYIELDAGGVEVLNLINDREVIIAYQGACTSCFSATGATLSYIQQTLQARVHPDLVVIPDMGALS